jgi:isocitrate lyase
MGGKVLVPTSQHIRTLTSARLASDTMGVPTVIIARTDALAANLITSDVDEVDSDFVLGERTSEGFFKVKNGPESAISRGLSYAPYADLVWCETGKPDIGFAKEFADAIHERFPDKILAYNCSPSFNWKQSLSDDEIATFQEKLSSFGYKFQFITLAGFHALNTSMFELAMKYKGGNMSAYVELQEKEFELEKDGFTSVKHQREVGAGYFDTISTIISGGDTSTLALEGSTEEEQF